VNRLATPNEGVRADLEQLEERVQQLEGLLAESESENSMLRDRIADVEAALEDVRALATAPPPPVRFEPPTPARVQVLEVTELDDTPGTAPPVESNPAAEAEAKPGAGDDAGETAPAIVEETGQELYDRAREQYLNRDYVGAELGFQRYLDAFPDSELSDNALFWIGECRFARGDNRGAMVAFQTMLHEYPLGNKVPDALLKVGRTLERLGDREGAKRRFREVSRRFPASETARRAAESLSRLQDEG
jgi:tol-pal system protein YbgF